MDQVNIIFFVSNIIKPHKYITFPILLGDKDGPYHNLTTQSGIATLIAGHSTAGIWVLSSDP